MHKIGQASKLSAYIPVPLRVTMMMANALSQMYKFPWPFIIRKGLGSKVNKPWPHPN